ncbi:MAG: hypothetical protein JEZ05_03635 [Tenericutes bacterium]|nr:hypothetical protein [Mycoplasmatota bacterium]
MLKKSVFIFISFILLFAFLGCSETITTEAISYTEQAPTVESGYLVDNIQDANILHAWNWSMTTIEGYMEEIAIAGFSAIQISPMQPQKDYYGVASWGSSWWKFYQPLGFSIATENHALGTKAELESMCEAADEYGIKIIVDVVANHLAGGTNESLNSDVLEYEPEIYNQNLIHTDNGLISDTSLKATVQGAMGQFPDLQTETEVVQLAVLDLLKEYVDVGVDGFRFDAAKHIETPEDGDYASDFWPTVIDGVTEYAQTLGITDLYFYGEILNSVGTGRSYSDYTQYMSITENGLSYNIRNGVLTKNTERLMSLSYQTGVTPDKAVLWAESHDTYASGETDSISDLKMTKAYAIAATTAYSSALYFARPAETTLIGECGTNIWQSIEVTEINKFNNYFVNANEYSYAEDGFYLRERYSSLDAGVVIVDIDGNQELDKVTVSNFADGYYHDQIGGTTFTVKNGKISGMIGESGIAVIYNNTFEPKPTVYVSDDGTHGSFSDTKVIDIYSYNTTEANYSINGGEKVSFEGNIELSLEHPDLNATVTLDIEVYFNDYVIEKHYEYIKSNIVVEEVVVNNIDTQTVSDSVLVAWVWGGTEDGRWVEGVYNNGTFTFDIDAGDDHFLLVAFPSGTTDYNWNINEYQTNDVEIPADGIFDGSTLVWA